MKLNDAVIGAFLLLIAAVMVFQASGFPGMPGQKYGPALFPSMIAAGLAVCGVIMVVRGLTDGRRAPWLRFGPWIGSPRHLGAAALVIGGLVFYILVSETLGFVPTGIILLFALLLLLYGRPAVSLAISIVVVLAIQYSFSELLRVPLPAGLLRPLGF